MAAGDTVKRTMDVVDQEICDALSSLRRLAQDGTWQDCAETNEPAVLRALADLIEIRSMVVDWQKKHQSAASLAQEAGV